MLFRQLVLTAIRSMTVKKLFGSSCGLNSDIFSTARAEGLVSQVAPAAATHILYRRMYVVNRGIVRSVSQQQVHKCRILSDKYRQIFSEKNIWQVIMCQFMPTHRPALGRFLVRAHLILSYFIMHCKCDRGQSRSSIHAAARLACTSYTRVADQPGKTIHRGGAYLAHLNHSSLYTQCTCMNLPRAKTPSSTLKLNAIWSWLACI